MSVYRFGHGHTSSLEYIPCYHHFSNGLVYTLVVAAGRSSVVKC